MAAGSQDLLHALNRFGLGARPGDAQRIAGDPRGAVSSQLKRGAAAEVQAGGLASSQEALRANRLAEMQRERERQAMASSGSGPAAPMAMADQRPLAAAVPKPMGPRPEPQVEQVLFRAEAGARLAQFAQTETPLLERLALFWSNHFCVSVAKGGNLRACAGAYEREAIRPHVLGRFADMLKAVETHPAMLYYLDNNASIGPNSRNGRNSRRGLNENLAREILELHTLGVDGGYTQADVTALARIITGWTVTSTDEDLLHGGRFTFAPARHEPGAHEVLRASYAEGGLEQGMAALDALARHPSTSRHVARKLARHFVSDEPPPALVEVLEKRFRDTDGDLFEVTKALVTAPEAWSTPPGKLRSPVEFLAAGLRATGRVPEPPQALGWLSALGQPLWQPPGPNGFPDRVASWASPEGMAARLDLAAQWGRQSAQLNPRDLLEQVLGPAASPETRQAVARAESRPQGLALLFMSPEFQRR
ncbi:DUF1800 domain-containing protein [Alsobacter sp. R-9]